MFQKTTTGLIQSVLQMDIWDIAGIVLNPFNGEKGWISSETFDLLIMTRTNKAGCTKTFSEVGYHLVKEVVCPSGLIWCYLVKK